MHKSSRAKSDGAGVYVKFIPTLRVIVTARKHYDSNVGEKEDGKEENERERKREEERERETGWGRREERGSLCSKGNANTISALIGFVEATLQSDYILQGRKRPTIFRSLIDSFLQNSRSNSISFQNKSYIIVCVFCFTI